MARRRRERYVEDSEPIDLAPRRRVVRTERRAGGYGGYGGLNNPVVLMVAVVLTVFILVLVFGYLL